MNWLLWNWWSVQNIVKDVWECARRQGSLKECVRTRGREVGNRMSLKHEVALIKVSFLWNDHLLSDRIVKLPALVALRVSNEYTLVHVSSKAPKWSLVPLDEHISSTAPNTKHRQIWLASIESFMWGAVRECWGDWPVAGVNESSQCLSPGGCGHPRLIKHGDNTFFHRSIAPLCYTILLRAIPDSVLSLDAILNAECLKLLEHILSTLIIPQSTQFHPSDILSPSLELLECMKGLRFLLQEVNCFEVREVISEGDPVAIPLMCGTLTGPWTSLWTSWRGFEALEDEGGKGSACIFPALQASHTGSGSACESSLKPVTRLPDCSFLMPARWWWQRWRCQRSQSKGRVVADEREANSSTGIVSPTRKAELEAPVFAWKAILLSLMKCIVSCSMHSEMVMESEV